MSLRPQDKVDMSLDDIIKISKSEKRKKTVQIRKGLVFSRGQGIQRGRGRGRGRGAQQNVIPETQSKTNIGRGRGRGRGGFQQRNTKSLNPLDRISTNQFTVNKFQGRGRGRNANFQNKQRIQTNIRPNSGLKDQQIEAQKQAALLREKQLALKNLQLAKQNVQNVNLALQKTSREFVVNQKRGLNNITPGAQSNRGGRGKLINQPIRQLHNTSVTVLNPAALNNTVRGRRKNWRGSANKQRSEHFTIQVANENLHLQQVKQEQVSITDQLKLLKPAVPTSYKFQKSMFAVPATGLSLNERFSSSSSSIIPEGEEASSDGRKVFM